MKIAHLIFLLFNLIAGSAYAQLYTLKQFRVADGLPQSTVNDLAVDSLGYLWIGTGGGGLARFDGSKFQTYTKNQGLGSNQIESILLSKTGLWIAHPEGISKFNGHSFKKINDSYLPLNSKFWLRRIFAYSDTVFTLTSEGKLLKIHNDSVYYVNRPIIENLKIVHLHMLPNYKPLFLMSDSTMQVWDGSKRIIIPHKDYFNRISVVISRRNNVWLTTDKGGFLMNLKDFKFTPVDSVDRNYAIRYDTSLNCFWGGGKGYNDLIRFDQRGKVDTVLKNVYTRRIVTDKQGITWIATTGKGLYKYFVQDFDRYNVHQLKEVFSVFVDKQNTIWVGTKSNGLFRIQNDNVSKFSWSKNITHYSCPVTTYDNFNNFHSIIQNNNGDIWVATNSAIGQYNKDKDSFNWLGMKEGLPFTDLHKIEFDSVGRLWFGSWRHGIGYFYKGKFTFITEKNGLPGNSSSSIKYSAYYNSIFVGSNSALYIVDKHEKVITHTLPELLRSSILSINFIQQQWALLGTSGNGIILFNPKTKARKQIDTSNGLASDFVYFVATENDNVIWVGTDKGISRVSLDAELGVKKIENFGIHNGLEDIETNQNAYFIGSKKYFGLIDGLYEFNDSSKVDHNNPLHFTNISLFNGQERLEKYTSNHDLMGIPVGLKLPHTINHVTFSFNKVNTKSPENTRYQYYLENFDKQWSEPSPATEVIYSNLPPGNYKFKIKATLNNGYWGEEVKEFSFKIVPPFYQTVLFKLIAILFFVLLFGFIAFYQYQSRVKRFLSIQHIRQQEQDSIRKELARDFHDELGNKLVRIINYISHIKIKTNNDSIPADVKELFDKIQISATELYSGTKDFIWSIDPGNNELTVTFMHLKDFAEKLFDEKNIKFRTENSLHQKIKINYGSSREILLIFKEAMVNIFRHSNAKSVQLKLEKVELGYSMKIIDDGCGFNKLQIKQQNGLENMRSRAEKINAILTIESFVNGGTKIDLIIKK